MKLLDAVNLVLPKLGERPVTSLAIKHDTLAVLLPIVENTLRTFLSKGWWFNAYDYTAYPDTNGEIAIGVDTLEFVPKCPNTAVQRGNKLFNPTDQTFVFTQPIKARVVQYVAFDDLPEAAANYVFNSALVTAYVTDLGATSEVPVWQAMAAQAWSDVLGAHLRQKKYNTRNSREWRRYNGALQA